ncbi:hypothetical protein ACLVXC_003870 [Vibrio alginolyticus]|uniref:hypothetical protein n=1 Tax=Vibrio harveyi group TaxID=717610 RepID=UPI001123217A|nr:MULTISPECIES: hypothetical protein [Vibrio harveyi group]EKB1952497.1 hypothetical protein [Vibrio parahaemolyticus]ELA7137847.1 hypothetical protein [Vibrio parahaemolyticus]EME3981126.1 hypothetical protein [Vibrio alginolyticus]MCS0200293.1 hypothetical protein [Vibrio alginolyticus]TOJ73353.1 hypothetical protein CGI33_22240 [Vibrio parahaemolyticus]
MTKEPAVGITNYCEELDLSDFDIALPEQSPQPEVIKDLPLFVADESKILMVAAKDLEARLEKLCKALTAKYKVKYPIRYKFKVKKSKGLPEITWYRLILHRYPDEELEEKEVSEGVLRRFSNAMPWEIPLYLHLLDELEKLDQRVIRISTLAEAIKELTKATKKYNT